MVFGRKRKQRIMHEQVKDQHTSHWDLDMLSYDELEKLMQQQSEQTDHSSQPADSPSPKSTR